MKTCRICKCTDVQGCPVGCFWAEENLCSICDLFIDSLAQVIDEFTISSAAAIDQSSDDHARYTAAVNAALSEASGRLRAFHTEEQPLIQVAKA